ncbi:MAG: hypothetical protein K6C68_04930 [Ruminococcus sp.]|nr:hypothetical protein [Ruminococcus sp.]
MLEETFVTGLWDEGYTLSPHLIKSVYIGEDPFGNKLFDNQRSELGQLLYDLKYGGDKTKVADIVAMISQPILNMFSDRKINCVIPIPASKERDFQPVYELAKGIAEVLDCYYVDNILKKTNNIQSKNLDEKSLISESIIQQKKAKRSINVLLVDDVFDTGTTANACASVLREDPNIKKIFFVALTRTKG